MEQRNIFEQELDKEVKVRNTHWSAAVIWQMILALLKQSNENTHVAKQIKITDLGICIRPSSSKNCTIVICCCNSYDP